LLDRTRRAVSIAVSNDRLFYTTTEFPPELSASPSTEELVAAQARVTTVTLETLRLDSGELVRLPSAELRRQAGLGYYYGTLYARGNRAFEIANNTVTVVDTSQAAAPRRLAHEIPGWGCSSLEVSSDSAYCAVGQRGVEVIDLSSMR
jgi:hypothetical protein